MAKKEETRIAKAFKIMRWYFEKHKKDRLICLLDLVGDYIYDLEIELMACNGNYTNLWNEYNEVVNHISIYKTEKENND